MCQRPSEHQPNPCRCRALTYLQPAHASAEPERQALASLATVAWSGLLFLEVCLDGVRALAAYCCSLNFTVRARRSGTLPACPQLESSFPAFLLRSSCNRCATSSNSWCEQHGCALRTRISIETQVRSFGEEAACNSGIVVCIPQMLLHLPFVVGPIDPQEVSSSTP